MKLLPIFLTVFIDSLGFGLIFPLLGPLLLSSNHFLDADAGAMEKGWTFAFLVASFCIGQFFASPILGALSDRLGRKKILVLTSASAFVSYLLGATAVWGHSLTLLFISRILAGVSAGNFAVAQSYIADGCDKNSRSLLFGRLGMAWGSGFVIGPFMGARFVIGDGSWGWTYPFFLAALLCFINCIAVAFFMKELRFVQKYAKLSFAQAAVNVRKAFTDPKLKGVFIAMFIFSFGWGFFTEFCPIFFVEVLSFTVSDVGDFFAVFGLCIALCQGILVRPLLKKNVPHKLMKISLVVFSGLLFLACFITKRRELFTLLPCLAFVESLVYPSAASIISSATAEESQGEVLGLYNSVQWAGIGCTPLFSGALIVNYPVLPMVVASICMLTAFFVFLRFDISFKTRNVNDSSI